MKVVKAILRKLKEPNKIVAVIALVLFLAAAGGVGACIILKVSMWYADVAYGLTALFFGYFVYVVVYYCIKLKPRVVLWAEKYAFTRKFVSDYNFRTIVYAAFTFIGNTGYAVFNIIVGAVTGHGWYISLGVYYVVLSVARGIIVAKTRKVNGNTDIGENERIMRKIAIYRIAGIILLILTASLNIVLVVMTLWTDYGFRYEGLLIFVMAGYTVYKVIMAVHNLVKVRDSHDFAVRAIRNINFTTALVAVLALQTGLLTAFNDTGTPAWASLGLGTVICVYVVCLGIFMIYRSTKILRRGTLEEEPALPESEEALTAEE